MDTIVESSIGIPLKLEFFKGSSVGTIVGSSIGLTTRTLACDLVQVQFGL